MDVIRLGGIIPPDARLERVPTYVYQILYDIGYSSESLQRKQLRIRQVLCEWADSNRSGYGITQFWDFGTIEAQEIEKRVGKPFQWGMYVLLIPGAEHFTILTTVPGVTQLIEQYSSLKIITNE